ncbi:MAG TPA: response regulator transcription factor [Solirubrobacteraceae bacterium]
MSERPRVVIVDDHAIFRSGVRAELSELVDVVGEAGSVAEAVALIMETDPDVVLLDVHMPDGGGLTVVRERRRVPGGPVPCAVGVRRARGCDRARPGRGTWLCDEDDLRRRAGRSDHPGRGR